MIRPKLAGQPAGSSRMVLPAFAPPECAVRRASPRCLSPRQTFHATDRSRLAQEASNSPSRPARACCAGGASRVSAQAANFSGPSPLLPAGGQCRNSSHAHCPARRLEMHLVTARLVLSLALVCGACGAPQLSVSAGGARDWTDRSWLGLPGYGRSPLIARPSPATGLAAAGRSDPSIAMLAGTSPDQTPSHPVGRRTSRDRLGRMTGSCARARRSCAIARPASVTSGAKSTRATRTTCSASVPATGSTLFGTGTARHGCSCRSGARPATASAASASRTAIRIVV